MLDRDNVKLERVVREMAGATALYNNISSKGSATGIVASLTGYYGALNPLISSTGVAEFDAIKNCIADSWRRVTETYLDGKLYLSQALLQNLQTLKGSIVNITSISSLCASTLGVAYGTSKAAVMQLSR